MQMKQMPKMILPQIRDSSEPLIHAIATTVGYTDQCTILFL